jgi:uncharacterized protein (DUF1499 family)
MGILTKAILIALPIALFALGVVLFVQNNRIPGNLGVHEGRLAPLPSSPNAVSSQAIQAERQVAPLPFHRDLQETRTALLSAIARYPGRVRIVEEKERYIHCVFTTTMGFNDDVEFSLDAENKVVHFRSASRIGYSDMGLNRNRYTTLAALYSRGR